MHAQRPREEAGPDAAVRRAALVRAMKASPVALHVREATSSTMRCRRRSSSGCSVRGSSTRARGGRRESESLATAEEALLALTSERAGLEDGQDVFELGCGWGSLTLWMAERYGSTRIVAVSNSADQRRFITARAAERELTNVEVVTDDMNHFDPGRRFDRVVSVEMFEHMRNWSELLARIAGWLASGGRLFVYEEKIWPILADV